MTRVRAGADVERAKKLGAAYKPGFPETCLKSQTRPIFRTQVAAQKRELGRFVATTGVSFGQAMSVLRKKYDKAGMGFLPRKIP